ncbi:MAG: hypothetical protein OCD76_09205 [Reichenbachiella sp.]
MKYFVFVILFFFGIAPQLSAKQYPVFGNEEILSSIDEVAYYVYNEYYDSAELFIDQIEVKLPQHPLVPMLRAMNIAWLDQPFRTTSVLFASHENQLNLVIEYSLVLLEKDEEDLEGLFFQMSAYGLLAEYYAGEGAYMKALSLAKKTYYLIKETMDRADESADIYFLSGLYNYFRERYPERHPVYGPFLWFFMSGDKALGLEQLDLAVSESRIVKAEAHLYTAYVYLRYEDNPEKALYYIEKIHKEYPRNSYFKAKYVESLVLTGEFEMAMPIVQQLEKHKNPYYQLCALTYYGIYNEKVKRDDVAAQKFYKVGLAKGNECLDRGDYYRSLMYLGLGRIAEREKMEVQAIAYYEQAVELDEHDPVTAEAAAGIDRLD